ncbi:MAG TPA: AAA family ATPase [Spirochaetia bacterium]|nr:AAA family ATPase [Spirochaetales bacterium]HRY73787.1 AAA family ATPase [Spirochaetia bacterium]
MGASIVAISGKSGCGNSTVTRLLAERLGFKVVNYTFRNMAADRGLTLARVLELAGQDDSWDRDLDAHQVELARAGDCVIGSRLAMWLLPEAALRVYLWASPEIRAARIHTREGGSLDEVIAFTRKRDEADRARYRRIYGLDNDDYSEADLTVNTERFGPAEIASILAEALARKLAPKA